MTDVYHQPRRHHHSRSSSEEYDDLLKDERSKDDANDDVLSSSKRSKYSKSKSSRGGSSRYKVESSSGSSRSPKKGSTSSSRSRRHRHTRSTSRSTSRSGSLSRSSRSHDKSLSRSRSSSVDLLSSDDDDEIFLSKPTRSRRAPKGSSREFRERRAKSSRRNSSEDLSLPSNQTETTTSNITVTSITSSATDNLMYGDSDHHRNKSKSSSPSRSKGKSKRHLESSDKSSNKSNKDLLYGKEDEDAKAKAKASRSRGGSIRPGSVMSEPSSQYTDSSMITSNPSVDLLYGDEDAKAKARAKSSRRGLSSSSQHSKQTTLTTNSSVNLQGSIMSESNGTQYTGSTLTTTPSMRNNSKSVEILYGDDKGAKAKGRRGGLKSRPAGLSSSSHKSSSKRSNIDLLYGEENSKKSKASSRTMSTPGVEEVYEENEESDTRELLYGRDKKGSRPANNRPAMNHQEGDIIVGDTNGEDDNDAPEAAVHGEVVHERKGRRRSKLWIAIGVLCFVFVCIIGGVAAFVLLRNSGNDGAEPIDKSLKNVTAAPTSVQISAPTVGSPAPTTSPTEIEIYTQPTLEECEAIANNQTLTGQDNATRSDFNIQLDVTLSVHGEVSDEMVEELMKALQSIFVPALAGCDVGQDAEGGVENDNRRKLLRKRQLVTARYVILNGYVGGIDIAESEDCQVEGVVDEEGRPLCFRLLVQVSLWLKGETPFFEIASLISQEAQNSGSNLVIPFDLPPPFADVKIIGVDSSVPVPSSMPSAAPSSQPTNLPSAAPSPAPTALASDGPTVTASDVPSSVPTSAPSLAPVVSSISPTMSSDAPSPAPSRAPSLLPSRTPSFVPSMVPSHVPSTLPSRLPTFGPTTLPSIEPSMAPTTQCFCLDTNACDATVTVTDFAIGCGGCGGSHQACIGLSAAPLAGSTDRVVIGANACQLYHACEATKVTAIQDNSCVGEHSCYNRFVNAQSGSCHGYYTCASSSWSSDGSGNLRVGSDSCHGRYACRSHTVRTKLTTCQGDFACAGRNKIFVAGGACIGQNSCAGNVFTSSIWQAQTLPSYFGRNSCTCQNCCVCMKRVISNRCTSPGECCDVSDPTQRALDGFGNPVQDNSEAEIKADLGVTDLLTLFP